MADPLPICYLNGEYLPLREARISPLDRGFLYADGVYEVMPVYGGRPFRYAQHMARLARSMREIRQRDPYNAKQWCDLFRELIARNGGGEQYVYLQVSRGAEYGRNHAPLPDIEPTVFAFCAPWPATSAMQRLQGIACVTAADTRWARCDIKSVALLANVLLRQLACDAGAQETILLRDGHMMEASSSTVHVVLGNVVVTPPDSHAILPGTTRNVVEELLDELGITRTTRSVSEREMRRADEIWLSAATREVTAVTRLDGVPVGTGVPRPAVATRARVIRRSESACRTTNPGRSAMSDTELLKFPTDYPIKVVGRSDPQLRGRIDAIMLRHAPDLEQARTQERPSANGNFIAISYTIVARSREQVVAIATELAAADGVMMVI